MKLTPHDIAKMLDHSTLQPFLTDDDIRKGCELALHYDTASVCARPCDMPLVASLLKGSDVKVCTVIGFPHGAHRTAEDVRCPARRLAGCQPAGLCLARRYGNLAARDGLSAALPDGDRRRSNGAAPPLGFLGLFGPAP